MSDKLDRQEQAVTEAIKSCDAFSHLSPVGSKKIAKAAIAASDAQYVPVLVGALRKIAGDTSRAMTIAREALSQLPEDLR